MHFHNYISWCSECSDGIQFKEWLVPRRARFLSVQLDPMACQHSVMPGKSWVSNWRAGGWACIGSVLKWGWSSVEKEAVPRWKGQSDEALHGWRGTVLSMRMAPVIRVNVLAKEWRCADEFISEGAEKRGDGREGTKVHSRGSGSGCWWPTCDLICWRFVRHMSSNPTALPDQHHSDNLKQNKSNLPLMRS